MRACQHAALADVSLSREGLARLRELLVAESGSQAMQCAQHEALVGQLRGLSDVDSVAERDLAEACAARARDTIADIEHALDRLDAGSYGACEACGVAIPFERLEAVPAARFCVACPGRRPRFPRPSATSSGRDHLLGRTSSEATSRSSG